MVKECLAQSSVQVEVMVERLSAAAHTQPEVVGTLEIQIVCSLLVCMVQASCKIREGKSITRACSVEMDSTGAHEMLELVVGKAALAECCNRCN